MNGNSYNYDVAFSFLAQDELLATELNDLLQDHLKTFLYSKRQGEIAAKDGEQTFNEVFAEEARVVVVLYREGWGESPWTRIEQTAIRNRAFEHGYEFVIFIPLDDPPTVPKWLPRTRLWVGFKRWGATGAAGVIEARVQELGGEPVEESVLGRADRVDRALKFKQRRDRFLNSAEGVDAASKAFEVLAAELERLVKEINTADNIITLTMKRAGRQIVVLGFDVGLSIVWRCHYSNSLSDATLLVTLWDRHPPFPGIMHFEEPRQLGSLKFTFDILLTEENVWTTTTTDERHYSYKDLAAIILKYFMGEGLKRIEKR